MIQPVDPLEDEEWDRRLRDTPGGSFFHGSPWLRVLHEAYGYKPVFFPLVRNRRLCGLLPVMEVDSWLTGRRAVSLPFTDEVPLIVDSSEDFLELFDSAVSCGKSRNWKYIEFRSDSEMFSKDRSFAEFFNHQLSLESSEEEIFNAFRNTTKRNIKKARKHGVTVSFSNERRALESFYRIHCRARRDHGLPPQPFSFFKRLHDHVLTRDLGVVAKGCFQERVVSANIYLYDKDRVIYKYGANDRKYFSLSPSYLVMWEAIRNFLSKGFRSLDFGRTDTDSRGLNQFKRGWRPHTRRVRYHRFDLNQDRFLSKESGFSTSYGVFHRMPVWVLKVIGKMMYRHVA